MAMAAMIKIIATTISSSIREKPRLDAGLLSFAGVACRGRIASLASRPDKNEGEEELTPSPPENQAISC
jgi:hypothetical protein